MYKGMTPSTSPLAGKGDLGGIDPQSDPNVIVQISGSLCDRIPGLRDKALGIRVLPPDAPKSNPTAAVAQVDKVANVETPPAEVPVKKRGRPPGSKNKVDIASSVTLNVPEAPANNIGFEVYINCRESPATDSLWPWVDMLCDDILKTCDAECPDIRSSNSDRLGFGKWKGILSAVVKESITTGKISPGSYHLIVADEIGLVVADALRSVSDVYVRA